MCCGSIEFIFPIDGDCVNGRDGDPHITACIKAPERSDIYINGSKARSENELFYADVLITDGRNTVMAEDRISGISRSISVFRFPRAEGKYRLSSDDNILFLQNITRNRDTYTSIFDDPYLAIYKKAHDLYGARVHLNLFYEFNPEEAHFGDKNREYFNLSMMTDKFRDEFRANSDWLKLSFHSKSEFPDKPYKTASAEEITRDCLAVNREIIRFAGEEALDDSATVHWGEATREGVRALRKLGIRSLTGYFEKTNNCQPLVAYYTDGELCDHIGARDFWFDTDTDMLFGRIDLVLNLKTLDWVNESLRKIAADPHRGGFVSVMIHEQYFYRDYIHHLPDFEERVLSACKYLHESGYRGAHIGEI